MADSKRICSVDQCNNRHVAKGFCIAHYRRHKKGIDPHTDTTPLQIYGATCAVDGCNKKAYGRGYCAKHYSRVRRHGDAGLAGTEPGAAAQWIKDHAHHTEDECLIWPFFRHRNGYPRINFKGKVTGAHRIMCAAAHGKSPTAEHQAAHSCGKGHWGCMNPKHLRWATAVENAVDRIAHGTAPRGEMQGQAKLKESDIFEIRKMIWMVECRPILQKNMALADR